MHAAEIITAKAFRTDGKVKDFGPWANEASPKAVFPLICNKFNPLNINVRNLRIGNQARMGRSPIGILKVNELDCFCDNVNISTFNNWGLVILGTFNSAWTHIVIDGCGLQPVESGQVLPYSTGSRGAPGYPPLDVRFEVQVHPGSNNQQLEVRPLRGGVQLLDYFDYNNPNSLSKHIGKRFFLNDAIETFPNILQGVVGEIILIDSYGALLQLPEGVQGHNNSDTHGSFLPIQAKTEAGSNIVTLTAPIRIGGTELTRALKPPPPPGNPPHADIYAETEEQYRNRILADKLTEILGSLVGIPKAGSMAGDKRRDALLTRIIDVPADGGNGIDGFIKFKLAEPARYTGTFPFIMGGSFALAHEDTLDRKDVQLANNDTDFYAVRVENTGNFVDPVQTSSCIAWLAELDGAIDFTSCKFHGSSSVQGHNAQDAYLVIMDCCQQAYFSGLTLAHGGWGGRGQIWAMGRTFDVQFNGLEHADVRLDQTSPLIYLDPPADFNQSVWRVSIEAWTIYDAIFPINDQAVLGGSPRALNYLWQTRPSPNVFSSASALERSRLELGPRAPTARTSPMCRQTRSSTTAASFARPRGGSATRRTYPAGRASTSNRRRATSPRWFTPGQTASPPSGAPITRSSSST